MFRVRLALFPVTAWLLVTAWVLVQCAAPPPPSINPDQPTEISEPPRPKDDPDQAHRPRPICPPGMVGSC